MDSELLECNALQLKEIKSEIQDTRKGSNNVGFVIVIVYLHSDLRLHRPASTPEDQSEEREEKKKSQNESEKIAATRKRFSLIFIFEKTFLLDGIAVVPRLLSLAMGGRERHRWERSS